MHSALVSELSVPVGLHSLIDVLCHNKLANLVKLVSVQWLVSFDLGRLGPETSPSHQQSS